MVMRWWDGFGDGGGDGDWWCSSDDNGFGDGELVMMMVLWLR